MPDLHRVGSGSTVGVRVCSQAGAGGVSGAECLVDVGLEACARAGIAAPPGISETL